MLVDPPWFPADLTALGRSWLAANGVAVVKADAAALPSGEGNIHPGALHRYLCDAIEADIDLVIIGGNGFRAVGAVRAAEAKLRGQPVDGAAIDTAVGALRAMEGGADIDTVVLACTHFPLLIEELARGFGPGVQFVDGAAGIARRIVHLTQGQSFDPAIPAMAVTTGDLDEFRLLAPTFAQHGIARLERF